MPQCTQMSSSLGFLYFHPYLFLKKKIANIYKYKALFLFILGDITYTPFAFYHLILQWPHITDSLFTLVVAGHPYHGCAII